MSNGRGNYAEWAAVAVAIAAGVLALSASRRTDKLAEKQTTLSGKQTKLTAKQTQYAATQTRLSRTATRLAARQTELQSQEAELAIQTARLDAQSKALEREATVAAVLPLLVPADAAVGTSPLTVSVEQHPPELKAPTELLVSDDLYNLVVPVTNKGQGAAAAVRLWIQDDCDAPAPGTADSTGSTRLDNTTVAPGDTRQLVYYLTDQGKRWFAADRVSPVYLYLRYRDTLSVTGSAGARPTAWFACLRADPSAPGAPPSARWKALQYVQGGRETAPETR